MTKHLHNYNWIKVFTNRIEPWRVHVTFDCLILNKNKIVSIHIHNIFNQYIGLFLSCVMQLSKKKMNVWQSS